MDNNTDLSNVQQYNNETKKMVSSNLSTELLLTRSLVVDWSTCGLEDSWTSPLAKMFDAKLGVNNRSKCDIYKFAVNELTSLRIVQSRVIQCKSWPVHNLTDRELVCRQIVQLLSVMVCLNTITTKRAQTTPIAVKKDCRPHCEPPQKPQSVKLLQTTNTDYRCLP